MNPNRSALDVAQSHAYEAGRLANELAPKGGMGWSSETIMVQRLAASVEQLSLAVYHLAGAMRGDAAPPPESTAQPPS